MLNIQRVSYISHMHESSIIMQMTLRLLEYVYAFMFEKFLVLTSFNFVFKCFCSTI